MHFYNVLLDLFFYANRPRDRGDNIEALYFEPRMTQNTDHETLMQEIGEPTTSATATITATTTSKFSKACKRCD